MNREFFDNGNEYQQYRALGGIINEKDYQSALDRARDQNILDRKNPQVECSILQAMQMAEHANILLNDTEGNLDPRIALYVILRNDIRPEGVEYHHSQMDDQRIFAETLRMSGDAGSLKKLMEAFPNILFDYEVENKEGP